MDTVTVSGSNGGYSNALALPKQTTINGIKVAVTIEEQHEDVLQITEHPIEDGAAITDHSFRQPSTLVLRCGWSNSSYGADADIVTGFFSGGSMSVSDYVSGIYSQFINLQQGRQPLDVITGLRSYKNMLIQSLHVTRDRESAQALMLTVTLKQVIIVKTASTSLPAQSNQATPASTAEVINQGTQQLKAATPASGGSLDKSNWTGN